MKTKPRALLLSGYHAISQAAWADYVVTHCTGFEWQKIVLPPRYFSWRMRGAPLSFAALDDKTLSEDVDLLLATSSVDLATLQSIYPNLRNTFSILYFHENQFAYPESQQPQSVVDWQMISLYSALRADKVLFNSQYNQQTFIQGLTKLLKKLPDLVPRNLVSTIEDKSSVLPVPITPAKTEPRQSTRPWKILWNHRWEWDKQPELLLAFLIELQQENIEFHLFLTGQQFRKVPDALMQIKKQFKAQIVHMGFVDSRKHYEEILQQCDVVISTAVHEFQGIAIMEAVMHGCVPLLPNALSYPEFFPDNYLYDVAGSVQETAKKMSVKIGQWQASGLPPAPNLNNFSENRMIQPYQEAIRLKED